jgi:hypothetical protein
MWEVNPVDDERGRADPHNDPDSVDDQFRALMEGLRTSIPGVMVLFAFLLTLPLQAPFGDLGAADTGAYYVAFLGAAVAAVLLIAPSVHQRIRAPFSGIKRTDMRHVMVATYLTIAGTIAFAIAIAASVYLVTSLVLSGGPATLVTAVVVAVAAWSWFYLPLVSFSRD